MRHRTRHPEARYGAKDLAGMVSGARVLGAGQYCVLDPSPAAQDDVVEKGAQDDVVEKGDQDGVVEKGDQYDAEGRVASRFQRDSHDEVVGNAVRGRSFQNCWRWALFASLFWMLGVPLMGQMQPAYRMMGAAALDGLEIYDIAQDNADRYLIATNEGVIRYDFHRFQALPCLGAQSLSAFNLVAAPDGSLYCSNLNRQVFKIDDGGCSLFYTLKPEEAAADMSLSIGLNGELVIAARNLIRLDSTGKVIQRLDMGTSFFGLPFHFRDGSLVHHLPNMDSIMLTGAEGSVVRSLKIPESMERSMEVNFTFFRVGRQTYVVDVRTKSIFTLDEATLSLGLVEDKPEFRRSPSIRVYQAGEQTWIAGSLPGVVCLANEWPLQAAALNYEQEYISEVFLDREGNLLLGTFGKGIMMLPQPGKRDALPMAADATVLALYPRPASGELFMGSRDGRLMRFAEGKVENLHLGGLRSLQHLIGGEGFPYIIFQDAMLQAYDPRTGKTQFLGEWSLKDGIIWDERTAILATNKGVIRYEFDPNGQFEMTILPGLTMRAYHIERIGDLVIASTSAGLKSLSTEGVVEGISLNGEEIYPTAMAEWRGGLLAALPDGRVVDWRQGRIQVLGTVPIAAWGHCRKLIGYRDGLIAMTSQAFYTLGPDLRLRRNLSQESGLPARRVMDFALQGDDLWVSHAEGVQVIHLNDRPDHAVLPLRFAEVRVNGTLVTDREARTWPSDHRSFEFALAYPSLRYQAATQIQYRLLGYENEWLVRPNDGQSLRYNALAPGEYKFQARPAFNGTLGQPIEFVFVIDAPLYARPSFYIVVALLILAIVVLIFLQILRVQRRKAARINELNLSRLTAIQSQMNPHFLFNALNSIQDLVLKGDIENSYSYITTFSQLVRNALDYSSKEFIDMEQELRLLRLYLSLEQLRFDQTLRYEIETDGVEELLLPPFLIQPFVENALAHGLLHKEGERRLLIHFELQDKLICTIEDNGIGRAAAEKIARRQSGMHASFSSGAIERRFAILSEMYRDQFGMEYEDMEEDGKPVGTRVILRIPVRRMD
ncbi:MAG: histidine kinase [Bacteroidia bacterium]